MTARARPTMCCQAPGTNRWSVLRSCRAAPAAPAQTGSRKPCTRRCRPSCCGRSTRCREWGCGAKNGQERGEHEEVSGPRTVGGRPAQPDRKHAAVWGGLCPRVRGRHLAGVRRDTVCDRQQLVLHRDSEQSDPTGPHSPRHEHKHERKCRKQETIKTGPADSKEKQTNATKEK